MKFSLDELVRMTKIAEAIKGGNKLALALMLITDDDDPVLCQAVRNELTRRSLFKKGRGE